MTSLHDGVLSSRAARAVGALGVTAVLLLSTLATLIVAAALKAYCLTGWEPGHQPKSCYNDIQGLWYDRDLAAHAFPYTGTVTEVHEAGAMLGVHLGSGQMEYPALTGLFAWLVALPAHGAAGYLVLTALALTPFAFATSYLLGRIAGRRALLFAASPQLAAYAFLNWDLIPAALTAGALWAWYRRRPGLAALLLSLGTCAKIWPGFVLLPMLLTLLLERDVRAAARAAVLFVVGLLAVNLPFLLNDPRGWTAPYRAQAVRLNDTTTNTFWQFIFGPQDFAAVSVVSTLAILAVWGYAFAVGLRRRQQDGAFPTVAVAAAMVAAYIALGRIDSPQYALWLLPFLVVLHVPARWIAAYTVANLSLWLAWSWLWGTRAGVRAVTAGVHELVLLTLIVVLLGSAEVAARRPVLRTDPGPAVSPGVDVAN